MIDNPDLNFGLVRIGTTVESSVMIRNTSQISTKWSIKETAAYLNEISGVSENISSTWILYVKYV